METGVACTKIGGMLYHYLCRFSIRSVEAINAAILELRLTADKAVPERRTKIILHKILRRYTTRVAKMHTDAEHQIWNSDRNSLHTHWAVHIGIRSARMAIISEIDHGRRELESWCRLSSGLSRFLLIYRLAADIFKDRIYWIECDISDRGLCVR